MERKERFNGSVWEKIGENNSEVHAVNVDNRDWDEWVSKADWNDDALYKDV